MTENPDSDRGRQPEEVEISFEADKSSWLGNYRLLWNLQNEIQTGKSGIETVAIVVEGSRHSYPVDGLAALLRKFLLFAGLENDVAEIERA